MRDLRLELASGTQTSSDFELKRDMECTHSPQTGWQPVHHSRPLLAQQTGRVSAQHLGGWTGAGNGGERTELEVSIEFPPVLWVVRLWKNDSIN